MRTTLSFLFSSCGPSPPPPPPRVFLRRGQNIDDIFFTSDEFFRIFFLQNALCARAETLRHDEQRALSMLLSSLFFVVFSRLVRIRRPSLFPPGVRLAPLRGPVSRALREERFASTDETVARRRRIDVSFFIFFFFDVLERKDEENDRNDAKDAL